VRKRNDSKKKTTPGWGQNQIDDIKHVFSECRQELFDVLLPTAHSTVQKSERIKSTGLVVTKKNKLYEEEVKKKKILRNL
jgi:hypothetical protein